MWVKSEFFEILKILTKIEIFSKIWLKSKFNEIFFTKIEIFFVNLT